MQFKKVLVAAASVALAFGFTACGTGTTPASSGSPSNSSGGAATTVDFAKDVGVVLPTNAEPRWVMAEAAFKAAMPGTTVLYSQADSSVEKTNVETLITQGVKYIIICPQDAAAAAAAVDEAKAAGITVIAYDRLITGTANLDYYATFDSLKVGAAQAQYLVDTAQGTGNHLYLYAGAPTDNNAFIFFQGAWSVLQPKIADGTFVIENSDKAVAVQNQATLTRDQLADIIGQITTNWKPEDGVNLVQANLASATADQKGDIFALTPNDDTARPMADAFRTDPAVTNVYNTGQDLVMASVQYIIDGKQGMTVWKPDSVLVQTCADIITAVAGGNTSPALLSTTYNNGAKDVPSTAADVTTVTKDTIDTVSQMQGFPFKIENGTVSEI